MIDSSKEDRNSQQTSAAVQDRRPSGQHLSNDADRNTKSIAPTPDQGKDKKSAYAAKEGVKSSQSITRVFDIINRFYASSSSPKKITEPALKKLEERTLSAVQHSELLGLAQRKDDSLARTVNLAFAAFEIHSNRNVKDLLLKFAVDVGREGFNLPMEHADKWLPLSNDDRLPTKEFFRRYASRVQQVESNKETPAKEKKESLVKLRNLLFLSLTWQVHQGWIREDDILRFLRADGVFIISTHYPNQAIESLLKTAYAQNNTEFSPLGWLSQKIENTRASQSNELERLQRDLERLTIEHAQALEKIETLHHERDMLLEKTRDLEEALHLQKQDAQHASIHQEDDKHRLRSQMTKALKGELPRLEEALIALRRDPPKLHIVSHYVEETLNHLKKVLRDAEKE